jgi:hypothetical protein
MKSQVSVALLFFVVLFVGWLACDDSCTQGELRCQGSRAEMCSSKGVWELFANCEDIDGDEPWACCSGDAGESCYPQSECEKPL